MTETTCWADPLTARERLELATILARHCKIFYDVAQEPGRFLAPDLVPAAIGLSAECSDLHLDVTERAATPAPDSFDVRRLKSGRDWFGYLTLENLEAVAERLRSMLAGRRYTFVACNQGLRHYFPEARAGQELRDQGITTYRAEDDGRYGGITIPDTYGVWGLHTDAADQRTARERRSAAWEKASEEQRRTDTWDDKGLTYLHITWNKVEIEHYAPAGYRLYWVAAVEPEPEQG